MSTPVTLNTPHQIQSGEQSEWRSDVETRYRNGEWRSPIFCDLILRSICRHGGRVLDIGCGHGFDDNSDLQKSIADASAHFVGIEPDPEIAVPAYFDRVYRSTLEGASIPAGSIDVAYAVFVLEHVADAEAFWEKIHEILAPGGVFWGFTVDARHPFRVASDLLQALRLKDLYLNYLQGKRGEDRYENYPTHYKADSPNAIRSFTDRIGTSEFLSLHRPGQLDYYFPGPLRSFSRLFEKVSLSAGLPGSVLAVRVCKEGRPQQRNVLKRLEVGGPVVGS